MYLFVLFAFFYFKSHFSWQKTPKQHLKDAFSYDFSYRLMCLWPEQKLPGSGHVQMFSVVVVPLLGGV